MKNIIQNGFEEKLQELEQYAVRQLPANVEPRFAFKLPQPIDSDHGTNDKYLRNLCAQETGRVVVLAADKQSLYEVPLEKVITLTKVKDVLQGNDTRRFDIIVEDENEGRLFK